MYCEILILLTHKMVLRVAAKKKKKKKCHHHLCSFELLYHFYSFLEKNLKDLFLHMD